MTRGDSIRAPCHPVRFLTSPGLRPETDTAIRTSPGPGWTSGMSPTTSVSRAGPWRSYQAARTSLPSADLPGGLEKIGPQLVRVLTHDEGGLIDVQAPGVGQSADVDGVEPELLVETVGQRLGARVVAGVTERSTVRRAHGRAVGGDRRRVEMVKRPYHLARRQPRLHILRHGDVARIDLGDRTVALCEVVAS